MDMDYGAVHMEFVVDKVAVGHAVPSQLPFHKYFIFSHLSLTLTLFLQQKETRMSILPSCFSAGARPTARFSLLFSGQWHDQIL